MSHLNAGRTAEEKYTRSHEPVVWSLFGAGGMIVAFLLPAVVIFFGFFLSFGLVDQSAVSFERVIGFAGSWWGKLYLGILIIPTLYHVAHRIFHGLHDVHVKGPGFLLLFICYGGSTLLSTFVLYLLWRIG